MGPITKLKSLSVSHSNISELPTNLTVTIQELDLSFNQISNVYPSWGTNLVKYVPSDNVTISFSLNSLYLASNKIDVIPEGFGDSWNLKIFDISRNPIASLCTINVKIITILDLSQNWTGMTALKITHTYITSLISVPPKVKTLALQRNPFLETLALSSSSIVNLTLKNLPAIKTISNLPSSITDLVITDTPCYLQFGTWIPFSFNSSKDISNLDQLVNITIANARLAMLPMLYSTKLSTAEFSSCLISYVDPSFCDFCANLVKLDLSQNLLASIPSGFGQYWTNTSFSLKLDFNLISSAGNS